MGLISIERIKELFCYDPITGIVQRIKSEGKAIAGQIYTNTHLTIDGYQVRTNRLAWALHNGCWPPIGYWVDHKNGVKSDNTIINLRLATPTQNQQNKAGYGQYAKGVTWRDRKERPWQAKIRVNGDRLHLGSFETEEEASEAYQQAALKYHGEFACLE